MPYEFYPLTLGIVLILGLVGLHTLHKHLREKNQLRRRELIHKERVIAMEKEVPVPEPLAENGMSDEIRAATAANGGHEQSVLWVRLSALCVGLFFLFTGVGMSMAFALSRDSELKRIWSIGLLPSLAGTGPLLFFLLSRGFQSPGRRVGEER